MAETYGTEWTNAYITSPRVNNYAMGARKRAFRFNYTQVLAGAAADTILLMKLPPHSTISMYESWIRWATATATATLSLGWQAYTDEDATVQALSAAGLLSSILLTADGSWTHGVLSVSSIAAAQPVVSTKVFNNRTPVTLYATIGVAAPGVGFTMEGRLAIYTP